MQDELDQLFAEFAPLFTRPTFTHALLLLKGAILALGSRTVAAALRAVSLQDDPHFLNYHRVLSCARWKPRKASRLLLQALVRAFAPDGQPLVFGIDDWIERRWGPQIKARGIYRDPVRSSRGFFVKTSGLRWVTLMFLPHISWAHRVWGLPFLSVLAPSERYAASTGRRHKTVVDLARQIILQLARWLPDRQLIVLMDLGYTGQKLLGAIRKRVTVVAQMRLDSSRLVSEDRPHLQRRDRRRAPSPLGLRKSFAVAVRTRVRHISTASARALDRCARLCRLKGPKSSSG